MAQRATVVMTGYLGIFVDDPAWDRSGRIVDRQVPLDEVLVDRRRDAEQPYSWYLNYVLLAT